jgi:hypothetical protein
MTDTENGSNVNSGSSTNTSTTSSSLPFSKNSGTKPNTTAEAASSANPPSK